MRVSQPNFFLPFDPTGIDPFAHELIGMLEGQVRGNAKAEMAGDERHGGDEQRRIRVGKLYRMCGCGVGIAAIDIVYAEYIRQEDAVEQPALGGPGVVYPIVERIVVDGRISRMRPQARPIVTWRGHVEGVEAQFARSGHGLAGSSICERHSLRTTIPTISGE